MPWGGLFQHNHRMHLEPLILQRTSCRLQQLKKKKNQKKLKGRSGSDLLLKIMKINPFIRPHKLCVQYIDDR